MSLSPTSSCQSPDDFVPDSDSTLGHNQALSIDRCLVPRSTTPLLPLPPSQTWHYGGHAYVGYGRRIPEFHALLRRGATPLMCETFQLEFDEQKGISAWADDGILEAFSGDQMVQGDRWRIRLGRRIQLDPDDLDGAEFLEDLLEDALFYPTKFGAMPKWETIKVNPGEWVTQPVFPEDISDHGSSDSDSSWSVHSSMIYDPDEEYVDSCSDEYSPTWARRGPVVFEDRYDTIDDAAAAELSLGCHPWTVGL